MGACLIGAVGGWCAHARWSDTEAIKPCRDQVISVDGARGPVSCTHAESTSELRDGYLICKCRKK